MQVEGRPLPTSALYEGFLLQGSSPIRTARKAKLSADSSTKQRPHLPKTFDFSSHLCLEESSKPGDNVIRHGVCFKGSQDSRHPDISEPPVPPYLSGFPFLSAISSPPPPIHTPNNGEIKETSIKYCSLKISSLVSLFCPFYLFVVVVPLKKKDVFTPSVFEG